jgi:small-conductance mechanosensitive channel
VGDVTIRSISLLSAQQVWRILLALVDLLWAAGCLVLVYLYLRWVLGLFPWTRGAANELVTLVVQPMQRIGLGIVEMIPDLIFLAILFLVTRALLKAVRLFFESVAARRVKLRNFDADWAVPTYKLVRALIVALAIVVAYPYVPGSETEAFKGVSLFIGVILSLGSSSFIGNLIAGYSMTYRRAFKLGDRVRIGEHAGEVIHTRLLATHLRTIKNEEVIVPNSVVVGQEVVNLSSFAKDRGLILHTTVGIGYETPWRQVEAMLLEAAARTQGLLREPPPFVLQLELGTFAVVYEINVYCSTPERARLLYTELHRHILDVFNEQGVQIMTPAYEGDPAEPKVVPRDGWHPPPSAPPPERPTHH